MSIFKQYNKASLDGQLFKAIEKGKFQKVHELLDKGANIEAKNNYGRTPLMHAAVYNQGAITVLLIQSGADIEAKSACGDTALLMAVDYTAPSATEILITRGANLHAKNNDGCSVLGKAQLAKTIAKMNGAKNLTEFNTIINLVEKALDAEKEAKAAEEQKARATDAETIAKLENRVKQLEAERTNRRQPQVIPADRKKRLKMLATALSN